jgi:formamidopyrimidine-DNA glycosylase
MGDGSAFYDPKTIVDLIELQRQKSPSMTIVTVHKKDPQGHPLKKITLAGRGTFYCPHCQS